MKTENRPGLDDLDRKILNRIQRGVPLDTRPFRVLGGEFGISEEEMLRRVRRLWDDGVVRRLGPIINYPGWGMSGVLVAAELDPGREEDARRAAARHPEITHAYLRDHRWNFWFTVIAEDAEARDAIISRVSEEAGLREVRQLKRGKTFKLKVRFDV